MYSQFNTRDDGVLVIITRSLYSGILVPSSKTRNKWWREKCHWRLNDRIIVCCERMWWPLDSGLSFNNHSPRRISVRAETELITTTQGHPNGYNNRCQSRCSTPPPNNVGFCSLWRSYRSWDCPRSGRDVWSCRRSHSLIPTVAWRFDALGDRWALNLPLSNIGIFHDRTQQHFSKVIRGDVEGSAGWPYLGAPVRETVPRFGSTNRCPDDVKHSRFGGAGAKQRLDRHTTMV